MICNDMISYRCISYDSISDFHRQLEWHRIRRKASV